jgi:hypothetical protein
MIPGSPAGQGVRARLLEDSTKREEGGSQQREVEKHPGP